MGHDQIWKDVIWTFFESFIELFYPDVAKKLDFSTLQLVEGEVFTDLPEGSRRVPDLVVQVNRTDGEPEIILVHVEVQSERRGDVSFRVWEYYVLLRLRKRLPVFPIVLYLVPGSGGLSKETYSETLFGDEILSFRYRSIGLADLQFEDYVDRTEPLAVGLSALMMSHQGHKVKRKYQALDRLFTAEIDDARKHLLVNIVDKYLPLNETEANEMSNLLHDPTIPEHFLNYMTSWEEAAWNRGIESGIERGIERGIEQGIEQGIERGIEQGIEQGIERGLERGIEQGKHDLIIRLLRRKFGDAASSVADAIGDTYNAGRLDDLAEQILLANSIDELRLP